MSKITVTSEIGFKTARSGGKGGQNVNKVETQVEGRFDIMASALLTNLQKERIVSKLASRINSEGLLLVKSQSERTQLGNKAQVIKKINELINQALIVPRKRIATKPAAIVKEKRLESKKRQSDRKDSRKKIVL
jgi:ribosome-associated protein